MSLITNFAELHDAEMERLHLLQEECAEVIQAASKILRHGECSCNPLEIDGSTNRQNLEKEIGDVLSAIDRLVKWRQVSRSSIDKRRIHKTISAEKYLHHQ